VGQTLDKSACRALKGGEQARGYHITLRSQLETRRRKKRVFRMLSSRNPHQVIKASRLGSGGRGLKKYETPQGLGRKKKIVINRGGEGLRIHGLLEKA